MRTGQTKYEQYRANELTSIVRNDPFEIMERLLGERYTTYRRQWSEAYSGKSFPRTFPLHIDVDLQDACNQNCKMCHQSYRKRMGIVMRLDLLRAVIDEGAANGLCAFNFGASGEPLLQKDLLLHGLNYAGDRGIMDIFLHTNGILLDEFFASRLLDSGLKHLCVSMDAASEGTYRQTRNSNSFKQVVSNILKFCELRDKRKQALPTIRVSFCVNPLNFGEKQAFLQYWSEKADLVELQGYHHVDSSINVNTTFKKIRSKCVSPFRRIMVWPDGQVSLCCGYRFPDVVLGNLAAGQSTTIASIWSSPKLNRIRKAFEGQSAIPMTCKTCLDSGYVPDDELLVGMRGFSSNKADAGDA